MRELGYYIDLAQRLGYLKESQAEPLTRQYEEIARVLSGLINSLGSA